ncbi:MAG TPA: MmgE/PrpD family protein [Candidatus Limnocylindria bacterium]
MTAISTSTVAERLADHIVGLRFEDLPDDVVEKTKDLLVNHMSLAFAGRSTDDGQRALAFAHELSGDGGVATVVGDRRRARPVDAVFAHSGLISVAQWHDFVMPSGLHPGVVTHPAAWVFAEEQHRSGKELLSAVVVGYDAGCKLADAVQGYQSYARRKGYTYGPICSAATAARLLDLDRRQVEDALGIAAHSGMGLVEGTDVTWYAYPLVARAGATAALLARAGARSAATTIEGEHGFFVAFFDRVPDGLDASLATLGSDFAIAQASTKRYPSSGMNVIAIELMLDLARSGIREPDVAELVACIPEQRRPRDSFFEALIEQPEPSRLHAQGSLRFWLALILADGGLDTARFERVHDPAIQAAFRKVRLQYEPGHDVDRYTRLEVTMRDGDRRVVEGQDEVYRKGDWRALLRRDGERFLSNGRLDELERLLTHLEDVRDASDVLRCTVPDKDDPGSGRGDRS